MKLFRWQWAMTLVAGLAVATVTPLLAQVQPDASAGLWAKNYDLRLHVYPGEQRLEAEAEVTFENSGAAPAARIPFMLHRLLKVKTISGESNQALPFTQSVVGMQDEENWQVNAVAVILPHPVPPGGSGRLTVRYQGTIWGYTEVMRYVRDRIDENYTLFRAETLPYPVLGAPARASWQRLLDLPFSYRAQTDVPQGYVVICGGMTGEKREAVSRTEFTSRSTAPGQMLDIAIAKFVAVEDAAANLHVYSLPAEREAAEHMLPEMKRARELFTSWFGQSGSGRLSVIELPDGWGSYAGKGYIFQTTSTFNKSESISGLYHEIAHGWNARPKPELQRTRWFDEAFASYFEALAVRSFQGEDAYRRHLERYRERFLRNAQSDEQALHVPIAEYGKFDIGENSYTKGAWSLYVLHQVLGDEVFRKAMARFLKDFTETPAGFADFQRIVEEVSGHKLQAYFDEWIYGAESSKLLAGKEPIERIAARYK